MKYPNRILFSGQTLKRIDRNALPTAVAYYSKEFPGIKIKSEWIKVHCCFHADSNPSLGINLLSGGFNCFACGANGRDVISFVMLRYQFTFKEACRYLGVCL